LASTDIPDALHDFYAKVLMLDLGKLRVVDQGRFYCVRVTDGNIDNPADRTVSSLFHVYKIMSGIQS